MVAFEVIDIDHASVLFLREDQKVWIVIFKYTIYRAINFERATPTSAEIFFLLSFKRFIFQRRRPSIIYCDNGSNSVGAEYILQKIDWIFISRYNEAQKII